MNEQQIIDIIVNAIVSNNNNEITADVLRPVLTQMATQINGLVGALADLDTTDKTSIVNAINEIKNESGGTGATVFSGTTNPNDGAPPAGIDLGDYYNRTSGGSTIEFYIWNGNEFVLLIAGSDQNNNIVSTTTNYTIPKSTKIVRAIGSNNITVTLPDYMNSFMREIILINDRNSGTMTLSDTYHDFIDGTLKSTIPNNQSITIKNQLTSWIRIR